MLLPNRFRTTGALAEGLEGVRRPVFPVFGKGLGLVLPGLVRPEDFLRCLGFGGNDDSDDFRRILELLLVFPVGLNEPNTMLFALGEPVNTLI